MPELPEIETLRKELSPTLLGKRVVRVNAYRSGLREAFPTEVLGLHNEVIRGVERRSKYLRLLFAQGSVLIHLGMSGQLRLVDRDEHLQKHDHIEFLLDDGRSLRLRDPRRFGVVLWEACGNVHHRLTGLGPEPLSDHFNKDYLLSRLKGKNTPIKTALMDAGVVVGAGNIYASEALFDAGISPFTPAKQISPSQAEALVNSVKKALELGISLGGSSMRDYVHADGSLGGFLSQAKVYGRAGKPCLKCGHPLRSDVIGGRGTVWCEQCQH